MKKRMVFSLLISIGLILSACGTIIPTPYNDFPPRPTSTPGGPAGTPPATEDITPAATHELNPGDGVVSSNDPTAVLPTASAPGGLTVNPGTGVKGVAVVDSIELLTLESFPLQIHAILRGNLPDGCTTIGQIDSVYDAATKTFTITPHTTRPADMMCTQALVPFEQNVALDVYGLAKGTYVVVAGSNRVTFDLGQDNILPTP
jgi:inhibitor of cysteine peptidase